MEEGGLPISSMLLAGPAGGVPMSNILRIGVIRGEFVVAFFAAMLDKSPGGSSELISNMLRTVDWGLVRGDDSRADVLELADPLVRPAGGPSSRAKTSFRSSSNMDSNDICLAILVGGVDTARYRSSNQSR